MTALPRHNAEIATVFDEIADLLDLENANPFRVRAYRNAARLLRGSSRDVAQVLARGGDLTDLPGIGRDLAGKIREVTQTGDCALHRELERHFPPHVTAMLAVPGLGPRRVRTLIEQLGVRSLDQLAAAAREGRVRALPGFGVKTEANLLRALGPRAPLRDTRLPLAAARPFADALRAYLERVPGVRRVEIAGSYRRARETVGDLDVLVSAGDAAAIEALAEYGEVARVAARGETEARVELRSALQIDLRVVPPRSFGAALHYFTGSKAHNIAVRRLGQARGLKINEYGVFRGARRVGGAREQDVFAAVGLPFIEPELREDQGEIEAARAGRLPRLVELSDLRGDLHAHTRASDGHNTLEEMAAAARERGLAYAAVTEHSRRLRVARGMDSRRLLAHLEAVDRLNDTLKGITLLKGVEVDVLEDGTLDLPDATLAQLDLVVASVHSHFDLAPAKQTARILRALDNRYVTIFAHPTGRLLRAREPYAFDLPRVLRAARARGCFLEVNAQPDRLDLNDAACRLAKEEGVRVSIASDAHSVLDFDHLWLGVAQARRGWLEPDDVINTRPLPTLRKLLAAARG